MRRLFFFFVFFGVSFFMPADGNIVPSATDRLNRRLTVDGYFKVDGNPLKKK